MHTLSCRLVTVLPILTFFSVLAHAQGTTPSSTLLLPAVGSAGQTGFAVNVRPKDGIGPPFPPATGTVTLYNGATAIGLPATLTPGSGFASASFAAIFGTPDPAVAAAASGGVWGDFNGDRAPDFLVYGTGSGAAGQPGLVVQTFIAKIPQGLDLPPSFTPVAPQQLALPLLTHYGQRLAVLDVDGDGHLDLLAGNTVAYGKGDGTFGRVAVLPDLASGFDQTYAVDIDGDGKTDIVAVNTPPSPLTLGTVQYAFTVFHNNGGGSFTAMGPFPLAPSFAAGSSVIYNIFGLSFADVNGDGRMDVLSQSNTVPNGNAAEPARLNIMLNLGPGFGAPKAIDTSAITDEGMVSTSFNGLIFTDLNDDAKQDLVFSYQANTMNNGVATLLGNGDGTFAAPVNFTIGSTLSVGSPLLPLITEDVNADGNTDVILGNGVLLLGNGDGTLRAGIPLFTSTVAPVNAPPAYAMPGLPSPPMFGTVRGGEVIFINLQSGANAVFIPNLGSDATLTALLSAGTYSLTAHYSGDATYAPSVSNSIDVTTVPVTPEVALTSSVNPGYTGENITLTATIKSLFAGPTGSIVFSDGATALATVAVSNGVASYTAIFSSAGNHTITAAYSGDMNNLIASGSLTQAIEAPVAVLVGGGTTTLTATAGQSASTTLSVAGNAGFTGPITFSCTGLPAYAACSFSPASLSLSESAARTTTLTVTTNATTTAALDTRTPARPFAIAASTLPLLGLLALLPIDRSRRALLCAGLVLFAPLAVLSGCSGGGSSSHAATTTAPGSYSFNVVAASATVSTSTALRLTVQ